jgi:hypothetical protein
MQGTAKMCFVQLNTELYEMADEQEKGKDCWNMTMPGIKLWPVAYFQID